MLTKRTRRLVKWCEFQGRSVRAKQVLDYAYKFLDKNLFTTKSNYEAFVKEAEGYAQKYSQDLAKNIMSVTKQIGIKQREYDDAKNFLVKNEHLKSHYNLDEIKNELDKKQGQLNDLLNQKKSLKGSILTYEKYLELFENISVKHRQSDDMAMIDQILRNFFSNFSVKQAGKGKEQRCSITHKLNEPWNRFVKYKNVACGRGERAHPPMAGPRVRLVNQFTSDVALRTATGSSHLLPLCSRSSV